MDTVDAKDLIVRFNNESLVSNFDIVQFYNVHRNALIKNLAAIAFFDEGRRMLLRYVETYQQPKVGIQNPAKYTGRYHDRQMASLLVEGLGSIPGVTVYGPTDPSRRTATVSFIVAGWHVSEIGMLLDEQFDVLCRVGLHCAPAAHRTLGTFPEGTVRFAAGPTIGRDQIRAAIAAVEQIVRS